MRRFIKEFLKNSKQGFCFDLSHLIVSTNILKLDLIDSIKKCLKLNPKHFHISGQKLKSKVDQHLSIQEGDIDFKKILRLYPRDAEITLEVSRDINQTERDLEKIRKILEKIN